MDGVEQYHLISDVGPNQPFYFSPLDVPQRIRVGSRIQALRLGPKNPVKSVTKKDLISGGSQR